MRRRPSARLLILNRAGRVLLFRFVFRKGALAGQDFWATPGGALEQGESFEAAAIRELREETGLIVDRVDPPIAEQAFVLRLPNGEQVMAVERFFVIETDALVPSRAGWTALEAQVMTEHGWWTVDELRRTDATVWPKELAEMIAGVGR
ncbi:MAG TPA: NUDIX domain-containing protein [Xanthobacteraceae bacterium]|nr:NUDIX domain-containing protein [Xanthobacteraceae bacterium]